MSHEVAISVRGLVTRFGDKVVHDHLDLDVYKGEVLGVVGPSGCGKTVLLREIVGLQGAAEGTIEIGGLPLSSAYERARHMGVMFQDGALFSKLTLLENVEVLLREYFDLPPALMHELASLRLVMAGLEPETHRLRPAQISGGMRKRAALARALVLDPELLLLDEPTAGLDPITAGRFDALLVDLAVSLNLTVFLVTHDLDTLYSTADRVAVLHNGKVAALGELDAVAASDDPWVRQYFGGPRGRPARKTNAS